MSAKTSSGEPLRAPGGHGLPQLRGNATSHSCVYHQWRCDLEGNLHGAPFLRGLKG